MNVVAIESNAKVRHFLKWQIFENHEFPNLFCLWSRISFEILLPSKLVPC